MNPTHFALLTGSYLLGSIPTAYLLGKAARGIDIREHGSGNVGATNALRVLGKKLGVLCLALDMAKGAAPALVARALLDPAEPATQWIVAACALMAIVGHIFTIFLRFKGGKGVASTLGAFLSLEPLATALAALTGVAVMAKSRYVALGSLVIAWLIPVLATIQFALWGSEGEGAAASFPVPNVSLGLLLAAMITWSHRGNIVRLLQGKERKLGDKALSAAEEAAGVGTRNGPPEG